MMNEMPYFRGGKTVRQCRLALVAGALLTFTFATASCSVVEDAVLTTASASPTTIKSRVTPAKAAYGYQKTGNAAVTLVADASDTPAVATFLFGLFSLYLLAERIWAKVPLLPKALSLLHNVRAASGSSTLSSSSRRTSRLHPC